MKLKDLIAKLEKAREKYIEAHGIEPTISSFDDDEGLVLCAKIVRTGPSYFTHKKPYKRFGNIKAPR